MSKRVIALALALPAVLAAAWFLVGDRQAPPHAPDPAPSTAGVTTAAALEHPSRSGDEAPPEAELPRKLALDSEARPVAPTDRTALVMVAVAKENGRGLPHTRFELDVADPGPDFEALTLESDSEGRAEIEVPAGQSIDVQATMTVEPLSSTEIRVPPLSIGERRELRIELPTAPDLRFWCRVVRDEDSAWMPNVPAQLVFEHPITDELVRHPLVADAEGLIEVFAGSWRASSLQVDVDGYAQAVAPVVAGYETSATAFELRLFRGARLNIEVVNPAQTPLPGLLVRASAHDYELSQSELWSERAEHVRSTFEALTDAAGRAVLLGLPARAELELSVRRENETLMLARAKQRLDPGEERDVKLIVGGRATLAGRAIDQYDRPLEGATLFLVKPDPTMGMVFRAWTHPSNRALTGAEGAFEFPDTAEGEWWVGPAPRTPNEGPEAIAAYGQRVVIAPGAGRVEVVLRVWRGLFLSGSVRLSSGEPAPECSVSAQAPDSEHTGYLSAKTDSHGSFELGPVCGVEYELTAGGAFQGDYAASKPLHAAGGTEGLVLVVERAAKLRGTVIDSETNEPCDAAIFITQAEVREGFGYSMGTETRDRAFEMTGITPGVWDVTARSRNARMATSRVSFAPGETVEVTLRVAPSVTLVFKNTSAEEFFYVFPECSGLSLEVCGADPGQEQRIAVPPGRVTLRICNAQAKTLTTRTLEIAPGSSGEVAYP